MRFFQMLRGWGAPAENHNEPVAVPQVSNEHSSDDSSNLLDLTTQLEKLHTENESLIHRLNIAEEAATTARKAQLMGEERLRRQTELLEEARKTADTAVKEQSQIMIKLTELQKWTDCIDDNEAVQVIRRLFQRLEDWIKRYCNEASPLTNGGNQPVYNFKDSCLIMQAIQAVISEHVFDGILSRFMVGIPDRQLETLFFELDQQIKFSAPRHVWQHWRASTSNAAASPTSGGLDAICEQIINIIIADFHRYTLTMRANGPQQLKKILLELSQFKLRLEQQGHMYWFQQSRPQIPFQPEYMRSVTGVSSENSVVLRSIWPMLCKSTSNDWIVMEKEVVQLVELVPEPEPVTPFDLQSEFSSLSI